MPKSKRKAETQRSKGGRKPGQASPTHKTAREYWQTESLAPRLLRLAQAIAAAPPPTHAAALTHADCQALLEFYVESEERKEDARARYPAVWTHLQSCGECRFYHQLLTESLGTDNRPDDVSRSKSATPLPFLAQAAQDAVWTGYRRSRIAGGPLGFGYLLRSSHIERLFSGASTASILRGDKAHTERSLLLSDNLTLGKHDITVDVWLLPSESEGAAQVEVSLGASASLTGTVRVTLSCGELAYHGVIREGGCLFRDVPLSEFRGRHDWRVEFEVGETAPAAQGTDGDGRPGA